MKKTSPLKKTKFQSYRQSKYNLDIKFARLDKSGRRAIDKPDEDKRSL